MKVMMTADTIGGVWTYAVDLIRALEPYGVEFTLASFGEPLSRDQRTQVQRLHNVDLFETHYRVEWMDNAWADVDRGSAWLLDLEAAIRPDVIHLNEFARGSLRWRAPVLVVGHSCVLTWWRAVLGAPPPNRLARYRREVRAGLHGADVVVAPTRAILNDFVALYGPLARTAVIHNGRDSSIHTPADKQPFVLSAGRVWDQAKNIDAIASIASDLPWPVAVAGDTRGPGGSRRRLPAVRQLGRLDASALARLFNAASIYAFPARYEPFGLSVLEAGLAGCALVLGDTPSLREVWGEVAMFVPPDDAAALRDSLLRLIREEDTRRRLAAAASERARVYTAERMGRAYLELYEQLTSAPCVQRCRTGDRSVTTGEREVGSCA